MVVKDQQTLLKQLQKQVRLLQQREEQSHNKLRAALKKVSRLGRSYKNKLAGKMKIMKSKLREIESSTYAKVAEDLEKQMIKSLAAKGRSLGAAMSKIEKESIDKLTKDLAKKSKKSGMRKKSKSNFLMRKGEKRSKLDGTGTGLLRSRSRKRRR